MLCKDALILSFLKGTSGQEFVILDTTLPIFGKYSVHAWS